MHLYMIAVPSPLSEETSRLLRGLGLLPTRTTEVWPAGAIPVEWDGESHGQWLSSDTPLLGIAPDHDLSQLAFELQGAGRTAMANLPAGRPMFLALPQLPVGIHELIMREVPRDGPAATRKLSIEIREPRRPSLSDSGPVRIWAEPYSRNLEELWDGTTVVCLGGPVSQSRLSLTLASRPGSTPLVTREAQISVPMTGDDWRALWRTVIAGDDAVAAAYDSARWARVKVDAGRFGQYSLEFERSLPPLRWRIEDLRTSYRLVLQDDTESPIDPEIRFASFERPNELTERNLDSESLAISADPLGGLYVARLAANEAAVIVPSRPRTLRSFSELTLNPRLSTTPRTPPALVALLSILRLWARAPLPGNPLARAWRARLVREIHRHFVAVVCGARWDEAEVDHFRRRNEASLAALRTHISSPSGSAQSEVRAILEEAAQILEWPAERRIDAVEPLLRNSFLMADRSWQPIVRRRGTGARAWAAELCLRLATDPEVEMWAADSLTDALAFVIDWSLPVRVARYLALAGIVGTEGPSEYPPLFANWSWR